MECHKGFERCSCGIMTCFEVQGKFEEEAKDVLELFEERLSQERFCPFTKDRKMGV